MGEPKPIGQNWFGYACGSSYVQNEAGTRAEALYDLASGKALTGNNFYDNRDENAFPYATSDLSLEDFHRETAASLPFEFDFGALASGRKSERYWRGR